MRDAVREGEKKETKKEKNPESCVAGLFGGARGGVRNRRVLLAFFFGRVDHLSAHFVSGLGPFVRSYFL
jgi:hypothetical protein